MTHTMQKVSGQFIQKRVETTSHNDVITSDHMTLPTNVVGNYLPD